MNETYVKRHAKAYIRKFYKMSIEKCVQLVYLRPDMCVFNTSEENWEPVQPGLDL
jgi:hypothetical protein